MDLFKGGWGRVAGLDGAGVCVHPVVNPEEAGDLRVKHLVGQEAGLQEKGKLKGMENSLSVLYKCVCMINDPHLGSTD